MRISVLLLSALLYSQVVFKAPELLVKTSRSTQSSPAVQKEFDNAATKRPPRDNQLIQLGRLDGLDLTSSDWIYKRVKICPEFSKHVFVQYQEKGEPNNAFMAIYPRGRGEIHIVRQGYGPSPASRFSSTRASTIAVFNEILASERKDLGFKAQTADRDWLKLAACYAELAGESSVATAGMPTVYNADEFAHTNVEHGQVSIVGIQIEVRPDVMANLSIEFNRKGFIKRVTRTESAKVSSTQ